jgi:hypothetical protein
MRWVSGGQRVSQQRASSQAWVVRRVHATLHVHATPRSTLPPRTCHSPSHALSHSQETAYAVAEARTYPSGQVRYTLLADRSTTLRLGHPLEDASGEGFLVAATPAAAVRAAASVCDEWPTGCTALIKVLASGRGWEQPFHGLLAVPYITPVDVTSL